MITASTLTRQPQPATHAASWQREPAQAVTDPLELRRARQLMARRTARLPGYLLPQPARELPGAAAKTVLAADASMAAWDALHSDETRQC